MNLLYLLPIMFLINAGLHFMQYYIAAFSRETLPVAIFGVIYLVFGILFFKPAPLWLIWVSLIISAIGLTGLLSNLNSHTGLARRVEYGILILDLGAILILILKLIGSKIF